MKKTLLPFAILLIAFTVTAQRAKNMKGMKQVDMNSIDHAISPYQEPTGDIQPVTRKSHSQDRSPLLIWADKFNDPLGVKWVADSAKLSQGQWYIGDSAYCSQKNPNLIKYTGFWDPINYDSISKESFAFIGLIDFLINGPVVHPPNAWIATKNPIDCSAYPNLSISFNQLYKPYNRDTTRIEFSYDGTTWQELLPDGKPVNSEVPANNFSRNRRYFNCSSLAGGQASVYFRFRMSSTAEPQYGYGYGWMIDDVALEIIPDYDVKLIERYAYFNTGNYWSYLNQIPLKQLTDNNNMFFFTIVKNIGLKNLTNVRLKVEVKDSLGISLYTQTGSGITLAPDASDTIYVDNPMFDVPQKIEDYTVFFNVLTTETDGNPVNNTAELPFSVSDSVSDHLWIWDNSWGVSGISTGQSGDRVGSMYYLTETDTVSSITAGFSSTQIESGSTIIPQLWVYDNVNSQWPTTPLLQGYDWVLDPSFMGQWRTFSLTTQSAGEEIIQVTPGEVVMVAAVFECHFTPGQITRFAAEYPKFHSPGTETAVWMAQYNDWVWFENGAIMSHTLNFSRHKYSIKGTVYHDINQNGIHDAGEPGIGNQIVKLEPGPKYTTTNNNGLFQFLMSEGNYTVSCNPKQYWDITSSNTSYSINLNAANNPVDSLDFGISANTNVHDVGITLTNSATRAGFPAKYWISYDNLGTVSENGKITLQYDPLLTFINSSVIPDNHTGNQMEYNYTNLIPGNKKKIEITFQMPGVSNLGDTLKCTAMIDPVAGDTNTVNNYDTLRSVITGSYDPNDKLVSPQGKEVSGNVLFGQELNYTIRFQNTGTDTAFNIVVVDTLDTDLDVASFNITGASHDVDYSIEGQGIVTFTFANILLPDSGKNQLGSNGFVKFTIKPKKVLPEMTKVTNKAYIFFDFNPAIITNEVINTYVSNLLVPVPKNNFIKTAAVVYPNPFSHSAIIEFPNPGNTNYDLEISDITGKKVFEKKEITSEKTEIKKGNLQPGLYFYQLKGEDGTIIKGKMTIR